MAANFARFVFKKLARHILWYIMVPVGDGGRMHGNPRRVIFNYLTMTLASHHITSHLQRKMELLEIFYSYIILKVTSLPTETEIDINYKEMIEK